MERKAKKKIVIVLIAGILLLCLLIAFLYLSKTGFFSSTETTPPAEEPSGSTQLTDASANGADGESSAQTTDAAPETPAQTTAPQETEKPTETITPEDTAEATGEANEPTTSGTGSKPTETTKPATTDPAQILSLAQQMLKGLSGDANEVAGVKDPKYMTIQVADTDDPQSAARVIVEQVRDMLAYEQSMANPKHFSYDYNLSFVETKENRHTFLFAYRFTGTNQETTNQNYDTGRLVADVCAYLDSLGKVKYNSQGTDYLSSQPVIVLLEHSYETALSIVKAQVESASAQYGKYDFFYAAPTVTTKGGVEQQALLFYIINK